MARSVWKELTKLDVRQPLCARAWGAAAANSRAIRRIVSAGISVMEAAHSGVKVLTEAARSSKPIGVCLHETPVVQVLADDHVDQRQVEGQVGAGANRQPLGCLGCRLREARVQ